MRLRIVSDIHSEFWDISPSNVSKVGRILEKIVPPKTIDHETTLVIAGDLGSMYSAQTVGLIETCLAHFSKRFRTVLYIPGNHEYYGGNLRDTDGIIADIAAKFPNVNFGQKMIPGWKGPNIWMFTMWTDFDGENPASMAAAHMGMNDYRAIKGLRDVTLPTFPDETLAFHKKTRRLMEEKMGAGDIVITHHLPSRQSLDPAYTSSSVNGAYASSLDELILERKPRIWIHGHTHVACDYMIGETRVLCNPHGYGTQYLTNGYNPELEVEFEDYVV